MSLDFVTVLAGHDAALGMRLLAVDVRLREFGFRLNTTIANARLDLERGAFDETDIELHEVRSIAEIQRTVDTWSGVAVEFSHEATGTIYALFGRTAGEFINVWLEVHERTYRRALHKGGSATLYQAFSAIASVCGADAGLGDLELSRRPWSPSDLNSTIEHELQQMEFRESRLYLIRDKQLGRSEMERFRAMGVAASRTADDCWAIETPAYRRFWSL
jgi:hypothetical protein